MPKIRSATLVALLASVLVAPTIALASSELHFVGGEVGYTFNPDHVQGTKTRADVLRELEQAKADGSYDYLLRGRPVPSRGTAAGRTREEVIRELVSMTPQERARRDALYFGN